MEFVSYLAGERWSDHPACTHPLLAALAREVNDLTSDAERGELLPFVTRAIGLNPAEPSFSSTIALFAASAALPIASMERQHALAVGILRVLESGVAAEIAIVARQAFSDTPDAERWAHSYLARVPMQQTFTVRAAGSIVHSAAVGIALACVSDADARLAALLERTIEAAEALQRTSSTTRQTQIALQPVSL
ncbi:MAG: hypothetical protein ABJA94_06040 [Rhodoglobus sp.]